MNVQTTLNSLYCSLLEQLDSSTDGVLYLAHEQLKYVAPSVVESLQKTGLLENSQPLADIICYGCEQRCLMPVQHREDRKGKPSAYIVCDKRDDISRVEVDFRRLVMQRFSIAGIAGCLKKALNTGHTPKEIEVGRLFHVGMASQRDIFLIRGINQLDAATIIAHPAIQQATKPLLLTLVLAEKGMALPVISLNAATQCHNDNIEFFLDSHLFPALPPAKNKRGAKQQHDWAAYKKQFDAIIEEYGMPSIDEPELKNQAAVEDKLLAWGIDTFGEAPSDSRLRLYVGKWLKEIPACN